MSDHGLPDWAPRESALERAVRRHMAVTVAELVYALVQGWAAGA